MHRRFPILLLLALLGALAVGFTGWMKRGPDSTVYHEAPLLEAAPLEEAREGVAQVIAAGLAGGPVPRVAAMDHPGTALLLAYRDGVLRGRVWRFGSTWKSALYDAACQIKAEIAPQPQPEAFYVCLGYNYRPGRRGQLQEQDQGLVGLEVTNGREVQTLFPIESITGAIRLDGWCRQTIRRMGRCQLYRFEGLQYLVRPGKDDRNLIAVSLVRGRVQPQPRINREQVQLMHRQLSQYLLTGAKRSHGLFEYSYAPRSEDVSDNGFKLERAMLATWALAQLAREQPKEFDEAFQSNLKATLKAYYRVQGGGWYPWPQARRGRGTFVSGRESDLGPIAIASLALDSYGGHDSDQTERQRELQRGLEAHWHPSGLFDDSFKVRANSREDGGPGEALLAWANLYAAHPQPELRHRILSSLAAYQGYFGQNHAPPLIPWLTMAVCRLPDSLRTSAMEAFVYSINDELVRDLQPDVVPQADLQGAFFCLAPHPLYGRPLPPRASSTALYLDGLADAFALARHRGQRDRAERYRRAIVKGLASLQIFQYSQQDQLYYLTPQARHRVLGAFRSSPWQTRLRIDNEAQALLALGKILRLFAATDYRLETPP